MRYFVTIRYVDERDIYPFSYECDLVGVKDGMLFIVSDNDKRVMNVNLQHVRSYDVVDKG